ncbi:hypothetical protein [Corynebacterium silvaticum]|uniref:Uncharacterized protein n=1 Tax=Corynebacterium silvaticum TaxID=2320431 RepID=A0ACD4PYM0_9CORY|nr:hypothetical protein [Corynebacterium silvaticum]MBH5299219.1 hypothetical protein [Corynebacterium silvaticum]UWH01222.1 hypothetical protein K1I39_05895 [Corynebacterium silvaticum]UWH03269.1 hypothetical protein K1I38_05905 [Corynebacterium silvaticum]UWH05305.1 hypothetical protein K1I36_05910 [Corynebacterium silvaticum]UXZ27469.1 hypothetical protein K3929_05910 [Corynebacterium silvaticum]
MKQRLWDYPDAKGGPVEQQVTAGINAYLVDGSKVLVVSRPEPLSNELAPLSSAAWPTMAESSRGTR